MISSLIYAGGGLEAFVKLNSWPSDFTAPTDSAYLKIGGKKFENIPSNILKGATWIEDLSFDSAVKSIGRNAFENCTTLASIMFPQPLTQIDLAAFKGCTAIKELTLPEQLKSIGSKAFQNCPELYCVALPDFLSHIGGFSFAGAKIKSISFPSSVIGLGLRAFSGCPLESVHYKNKSQNFWIDSTYFMGPENTTLFTENITELIALNGVTHIDENAFANCSNLQSVSLPSSVTRIGSGAFKSCPNLETIDLPDSLVTIDEESLYNCSKIKSLKMPASLKNVIIRSLYATNLEFLNISEVQVDINWSDAFRGSQASIRTLVCRQNQVEKVQAVFPNATLEIVDQQG